jgi:hypothetical protein
MIAVRIAGHLTDSYSRVARLLPALLVVLPISLLAVAALPVVPSTLGKVAAVAIASGLPFTVTQIVRDRGCAVEPSLFTAWGGRPTEVLQRWSGPASAAVQARRHMLIGKHLGIALPDRTAERADPAAADALYQVVTDALAARTRDTARFPLVTQELTAFGFRRNAYACRTFGLAACALAAAGEAAIVWLDPTPAGWARHAVLIAVTSILAAGWWRIVRTAWVRRAADGYARQLLLSLEEMDNPHSTPGGHVTQHGPNP